MVAIAVVEADITRLAVDVIVNAANSRLAGGGGVDGAIHRAAGAEALQAACRKLGGCPTGEVRVTPGFELPAAAIYHTVGPIWQGGGQQESVLLANCYRACLRQAEADGYTSIAFPAISCGVYAYPPAAAVAIAVTTTLALLPELRSLQRILFCCFDASMATLYREALAAKGYV